MLIFAPATLADLYDAAKSQSVGATKPDVWYDTTQQSLEKLRAASAGGDEARQFMIRNADEDPQIQKLRDNLFQNIPICESIVDEQSHWVYGTPPHRCLSIVGIDDDAPEVVALNEAFQKGYELNEVDNLYRNLAAPCAFRDRWAWVKTWDQKRTGLTRVSRLLREEVIPIFDPDDRDTLVGVVEIRKVNGKFTRWAYTTKQVAEIGDDWTPKGPTLKNALGRVPYVMLGSMDEEVPHQLADAFYDQVVAINRRSWYLTGLRLQAHAILVIIGSLLNKEEPSKTDGVRRTKLGMAQIMRIAQGGDMKAVQPNYDAAGLRESEQSMIREAFDLAKVSPEVSDSSTAAKTATEAVLRKGRVLADRQRNIRIFTPQEKQAIVDWLTVSFKTKRITVDPAQVEVRLRWPTDEEVLAVDENQARMTGMQEVAAILRTREDYVRTFVKKNAPDGEVDAYMEKLEEEMARVKSEQGNLFGGLAASITTAGNPAPAAGGNASRIYGTQQGPVDTESPSPQETA